VGHQSTNWIDRFVFIVATALFTSCGTTSPRNKRQQAIYLPRKFSLKLNINLVFKYRVAGHILPFDLMVQIQH
jgi:hypothetical protein